MNKDIFSIGSIEVRILAGFANGLSVICDVTVAFGLCYYFKSGKTGFSAYVCCVLLQKASHSNTPHRTDNMVDRLMLYAIQRGALTAYVFSSLAYTHGDSLAWLCSISQFLHMVTVRTASFLHRPSTHATCLDRRIARALCIPSVCVHAGQMCVECTALLLTRGTHVSRTSLLQHSPCNVNP